MDIIYYETEQKKKKKKIIKGERWGGKPNNTRKLRDIETIKVTSSVNQKRITPYIYTLIK